MGFSAQTPLKQFSAEEFSFEMKNKFLKLKRTKASADIALWRNRRKLRNYLLAKASRGYMDGNNKSCAGSGAYIIFMTLLVIFFLILRLVDYTLLLLFSILHYMSLERIKLKT